MAAPVRRRAASSQPRSGAAHSSSRTGAAPYFRRRRPRRCASWRRNCPTTGYCNGCCWSLVRLAGTARQRPCCASKPAHRPRHGTRRCAACTRCPAPSCTCPAMRAAIFEAEQAELHRLTHAFEDAHPSFAAHLCQAGRDARPARAGVPRARSAPRSRHNVSGATMQQAARFLRRQERHAMAVYALAAGRGYRHGARHSHRAVDPRERACRHSIGANLRIKCKAFRGADEWTRQAALTLLCDYGWLTTDAATVTPWRPLDRGPARARRCSPNTASSHDNGARRSALASWAFPTIRRTGTTKHDCYRCYLAWVGGEEFDPLYSDIPVRKVTTVTITTDRRIERRRRPRLLGGTRGGCFECFRRSSGNRARHLL